MQSLFDFIKLKLAIKINLFILINIKGDKIIVKIFIKLIKYTNLNYEGKNNSF